LASGLVVGINSDPITPDEGYATALTDSFAPGDEFVEAIAEDGLLLAFASVRNNPHAARLLAENAALKHNSTMPRPRQQPRRPHLVSPWRANENVAFFVVDTLLAEGVKWTMALISVTVTLIVEKRRTIDVVPAGNRDDELDDLAALGFDGYGKSIVIQHAPEPIGGYFINSGAVPLEWSGIASIERY